MGTPRATTSLLVLALAMTAAAQAPAATTGRIVGRVVGPLRAPVPAAKVWLETVPGGAPGAATSTDGSGTFVLSRVPWGRWSVRATVPGGNVGYDFVTLSPARLEAFASLRIGDAAQIRGRVVDQGGKPIRGAHLVSENDVAFDWYIPEFTARGVTDSDGRYTLDAVLLGPTTVRAWAPGHDLAEQRLHLSTDTTLDFALVQGHGVAVRVHLADAAAAQLAASSVRVSYDQSGRGRQLPSPLEQPSLDAQGTCVLDGLPAAYAMSVHVELPAGAVEPDPAHLDASEATRTQRAIELRAVTEQLRTVHGRLLDEHGRPLAGQTLVTEGTWPKATTTTTSDADGRFALPRCPGPDRQFWVRIAGDALVLDAAGDYRFANAVPVRATEDHELALTAIAAARVTGRLVDTDGHGIPSAVVQLRPRLDGQSRFYGGLTARTDAEGRFTIARVDGRDDRPFVVRVEGEPGFGVCAEFQLPDGATRELAPLTVQPAASIGGLVHGADGRPLPGARVGLRRCDPATGKQVDGQLIEMIADRTGRFRFAGLEPRGWRLDLYGMTQPEQPTLGPWFDLHAGASENAVLEAAK